MADKEPDQGYSGEDRRRYFRVEYPSEDRPQLKVGDTMFDVLDISERGLRFTAPEGAKFGEWVKGFITFHDQKTMEVEGKIVSIFIENAQPVEYGEPLFLIEKN